MSMRKVQISASIKLYRGGSSTVYLRLPTILREEYGITAENAKLFTAKYFRDKETDELIIRIEKLPANGREPGGSGGFPPT